MNYEKIRRLVEFDSPTVAQRPGAAGGAGPGRSGTPGRTSAPSHRSSGPRVGIAVTARMDTTTAGTDKPGSLFNDWLRSIQRAARSAGAEGLPVFTVMESVGPRPRYTVTIGDGMATAHDAGRGSRVFDQREASGTWPACVNVPLACWGRGYLTHARSAALAGHQ